jgi:hypothetical protein
MDKPQGKELPPQKEKQPNALSLPQLFTIVKSDMSGIGVISKFNLPVWRMLGPEEPLLSVLGQEHHVAEQLIFMEGGNSLKWLHQHKFTLKRIIPNIPEAIQRVKLAVDYLFHGPITVGKPKIRRDQVMDVLQTISNYTISTCNFASGNVSYIFVPVSMFLYQL